MNLTRRRYDTSARLAFPRYDESRILWEKWFKLRLITIPPELESWGYGYAGTPDIPDESTTVCPTKQL